ncbi:glycoside hydrolase family 3 N-terminal domain-containing protein [Promicromonospora sp. MEB111]|uniref:glycoside hydrolase family 3 protein n=1 Tax=Promicromonospora sp. MEB111 TaxID=3040301 RepID=UPI00254DBE39|nr:glycoside hydrolase family 3 N-terminal domain-containing protein [Promicromonospora sp. MEB111]
MTATDAARDAARGAPHPAVPYRDPALPVAERVADLLGRMTLAEKAGQMFQTMVEVGPGGTLADEPSDHGMPGTSDLVLDRHLTHLNVLAAPPTAREFAAWHNRLQRLAAGTRLGIPVTIASDPRHGFTDNPGAALLSGPFSQWPETLGLAATRDERLVEEHGDAARREYLAVGIRTALHPQVDLVTEPRWARGGGTFGEDADLTGRLGAAYVRGLQAGGAVARAAGLDGAFGRDSVSTMTKHFPGGGPQLDGEDPHFAYGREQVYPGGRFDLHLEPFKALLAAGTRQMMPYYGMPVGLRADLGSGPEDVEQVGFGFNRGVLTRLLREHLGFDGIICTDWGLVTDAQMFGLPFPARAWGVEHLSPLDRVAKILDAGADQLGGEACPEHVVELVESGRVAEERIDASVRRLLAEKFELGLFDERRYVDEDAAAVVVGSADLVAAGRRAQSRSVTVLQNAGGGAGGVGGGAGGAARLPLAPGLRLYAEGVPDGEVAGFRRVASPAEADVAVLRLDPPFEVRGPGFESFFHAGSLELADDVVAHVAEVAAAVPTVVDVHLDRPAVLTPLAELPGTTTLVVTFGVGTPALLDALTGAVPPEGRLPFDLPRSTAAVEESRSDVPFDTADPLFRFGDGESLPVGDDVAA